MAELQRITQGKNTIDTYNTKCCILIQKAELDEQDNVKFLINLYSRGLKTDIAKRILLQETPETLSGWMQKASVLNRYER